jgi:hypothetical protein
VLAETALSPLDRSLCLLVAGYCLWTIGRGLSTGVVWLKYSEVRRSDDALLFWLGIVLHIAMGVGCLLCGVFGKDVFKNN